MAEYNFSVWRYLKARYFLWRASCKLTKSEKLLKKSGEYIDRSHRLTEEARILVAKAQSLRESMEW